MDFVTADHIAALISPSHGPCVSMYIPTHRKGRDTREDPIRLKNLLNQAEAKLIEYGIRPADVGKMLRPARTLQDDREFWRHLADGLAVFINSHSFTSFRVPLKFDELIAVGERFMLKLLFPLLTGDGLFFVLAISQNQVRVLRCTRGSCEPVQSPLIPDSEEVILRYIESEKQLQWHTHTSPAPGGRKRAAMFHGQGVAERDHKNRLFEFFRLVAGGMSKLVGDSRPPIIFAGVDYLFPIFKQANQGLNVLDDFIGGNSDEARGVTPEELHARAWEIVEPYFAQEREKAAALIQEASATAPHRSAQSLDDAVRAAHDGRVEYLFVDQREHRWGRMDPQTGKVKVHGRPQPGDDELLDFAAANTFLHRGTVYAVDREHMPRRGPVAALLRF